MSDYPLDTSACAVVIIDVGELSISDDPTDMYYYFTQTQRIKILKDSCEGYGEIEIPYISFRNAESIEDIKGHTILPSGEKIAIEKEQMVTEEVNEYVTSKNLSFPNISPGVILEYSYTIRSLDLSRIRPWLFQGELPRMTSALKTDVPNWLELEPIWTLSEEMEEVASVDGARLFKGKQTTLAQLPSGWYIMKDVSGQKPVPYITSMANYLSRIEFQVRQLTINGQFMELISTWPAALEQLNESPNFGGQLKNRSNYKNILNSLAPLYENKTDNLDKVRTIYNLVQKSIDWNGIYSFVSSGELDAAFEDGIGNSADINLILLALLQEAGFTARPVFISTRNNGRIHPEVPFLGQFNHILVLLELDEKGYFLDPIHPYIPFGATNLQALNGQGMVPIGENVTWINIPIFKGKDSYFIQYKINENLDISGTIKARYSNYEAFEERASHGEGESALDKWEGRLESVLDEANVDTIKTKNLSELSEDFEETLNFIGQGSVQKNGDQLVIKPLILSGFRVNGLKDKVRDLPLEFPYPLEEQVIIQIQIPEGYTIKSLPENLKVEMMDGGGSFTFLANEQMGNIICKFNLAINEAYFTPERYEFLKNIFESVEQKLKEAIILIKS
jgi:hypothetical protein